MTETRLSNEDFFDKLSALFDTTREKNHGSIFLTQKRLPSTSEDTITDRPDAITDLHPTSPMSILVRATNGKSKARRSEKIKLSTIVEPDAMEHFFGRYADVCKSGTGALKKRDRSGRKKAKAKKRKAGGEAERKA